MSGGVDSSVTAALLKQQGYEVIGMMLRLWNEPGKEAANRCCTPDAMALARRVAAKIGIPFYAVDAQQAFYDQVVKYFIDGYSQGDTPNPCLVCNRSIRWEFLLQRALSLGAKHMATGHYVRLLREESGQAHLLRAIDRAKDQSYVLHVLDQVKLAHALFPLGEYTKPQVRQMARDFNLPVAERADSQDLCFLADDNVRNFLLRHVPGIQQPGPIYDREGNRLGDHQGLAFYTIGQRKGLNLPSQVPLYVLDKDKVSNAIVVGPKEQLGKSSLKTGPVHWISANTPQAPFRAEVKIRYKAQEASALVIPQEDGCAQVDFDEPLRDITAGQAAVFYCGDELIGGGIIHKNW
jgi:tRNA-specific 2-thiouridylase